MAPLRLLHLGDEMLEEILLRVPPDEPADLLRASLVCTRWRRLLCDPAFRRRYCKLHRSPPLLGYLHNMYESGRVPRFVRAVASPYAPPALDCRNWWAMDCRHGRVLIHTYTPAGLVVWDPITRGVQLVPLPTFPYAYFTATVLCATPGCDHLDCRGGPFRVVFLGTEDGGGLTSASVYSSETGAWGPCSSAVLESYVDTWPSLCVGDVLYFIVDRAKSICRFDLVRSSLSEMDVPSEYQEMECEFMSNVVMLDDGRLGFAAVEHRRLHIWAWQEAGSGATAGWKHYKVIDLSTLLPKADDVVGFVENTCTIFVSTHLGMFTLKIKSGKVTKVGEKGPYYAIVPYSAFYTPGQ